MSLLAATMTSLHRRHGDVATLDNRVTVLTTRILANCQLRQCPAMEAWPGLHWGDDSGAQQANCPGESPRDVHLRDANQVGDFLLTEPGSEAQPQNALVGQ